MTQLLLWRNPNEGETSRLNKVVIAEAGLLFLTFAATIETVAYAALLLISATFLSYHNSSVIFFDKKLESSTLTVRWAIGNLFHNFVDSMLQPQESFARKQYNWPLTLRDRTEIARWALAHEDRSLIHELARPVPRTGNLFSFNPQGYITSFFIENILSDLDEETTILFRELNPFIYKFALAKAIFQYAWGLRCNADVPLFLSRATNLLIEMFREENLEEHIKLELKQAFTSRTHFEEGPENRRASEIFRELKRIAEDEHPNRYFSETYFQRAFTAMPERNLIVLARTALENGDQNLLDRLLPLFPQISLQPGINQEDATHAAEAFINQFILSDLDPETRDLLSELDFSMYMFALTKAVFIYAFGAKGNDPLPIFFKSPTNRLIHILREIGIQEEMKQQLQNTLVNLTTFNAGPQNENARAAFTQLRTTASGELQESLFITTFTRICL